MVGVCTVYLRTLNAPRILHTSGPLEDCAVVSVQETMHFSFQGSKHTEGLRVLFSTCAVIVLFQPTSQSSFVGSNSI